ncbi:MAG TPA: signal peptidase I [Planctomycetaceae bacterium]|nr:signal peptidase I [Planctomycetaceae bacterium]
MLPPSASPDTTRRRRARWRTAIELAVSLAVLVVLFRAFLAGGYMIETGSMAPCLVGYHWQATCPSCRYSFAVEGSRNKTRAVCPNCGKGRIAVETLPRNDGDHLLVHRTAFAFRAPRRWEVVVFRNPNRPTQAYVKRMIGLPGESVEIRDGDIYIDGAIQAKPYATQRGMRIPVYDQDYRPDPDDPDWLPRWSPAVNQDGWSAEGGAFLYSPPPGARSERPSPPTMSWVNYRHWIRGGGAHQTSVPLARWPDEVAALEPGLGALRYDSAEGNLICRGALPRAMRDELLQPVADPAFRQVIERLYEASHIAPLTDVYGYNRGPGGGGEHEVRDLMLELRVKDHGAGGQFAVELSDGTETLQCVFDLDGRRAQLLDTRTGKAVRSTDLPAGRLAEPTVVEMSLMDHQALVALDGVLLFEPWSYPAGVERGPTPWQPARFGACQAQVDVDRLKLFRDVYYTAGEGRHPAGTSWRLRPDQYFVLGDNSPLSRDSRSWSDNTLLQADLFVGKPLVVHLPSRKSRVRMGNWETEIRIPELSRIRYIH